jgi:primase-polymerase (primpol)-like protein
MVSAPKLRQFDGSAIPPELMAMRRWAPWKGVYNADRHKFDKIPRNARQPE